MSHEFGAPDDAEPQVTRPTDASILGAMGVVPWEVSYGGIIGPIGVAAVVASGLFFVWLALRSTARRRARDARAALGSPVALPVALERDQVVLLRGQLRIDGSGVPSLIGDEAVAATTVQASRAALRWNPGWGGPHRTFRPPTLRLQTQGGIVTLRGPLHVVVGATEEFPARLTSLAGSGAERVLHQEESAHVRAKDDVWVGDLGVPGVIRSVREGDDVFVRGRVRRVAGHHPSGDRYREESSHVELAPDAEGSAMALAFAGPPRIVLDRTALSLRGLCVGVVLALLAVYGGGAWIWHIGAYRTAALWPNQRSWALRVVRGDIERDKALYGRRRVETLLAYDACDGGSLESAHAMRRHGRYRQAARLYESFGEAGDAAQALMQVAAFDEAADVLSRAGPRPGEMGTSDAVVFLFAGRGPEASEAMRRGADWLASSDAVEKAADVRCLADAIDAKRGDAGAAKRLALATTDVCRLAHADTLEGAERATALAVAGEHASEVAMLANIMAEAEGAEPRPRAAIDAPNSHSMRPFDLLSGKRLWRMNGVEQAALDTLAAQESLSPRRRSFRRFLAEGAALFELSAGDTERALRWADLAAKDIRALREDLEPYAPRSGYASEPVLERARNTVLRVLIELVAGRTERARSLLAPWADLSPSRFLREVELPDADEPLSIRVRSTYYGLPQYLAEVRRDVVPLLRDVDVLVTLAGEPWPIDALFPEAEPCGERAACRLWGMCTAHEKSCVLSTSEQCRASLWCTHYGACAVTEGEPYDPSDYRRAPAEQYVFCVAVSENDCRRSTGCEGDGACSLRSGRCVAGSDDDCVASGACRRDKRCRAREGRCVVGCEAAPGCRSDGRCTDRDGSCVVAGDTDCERSWPCRKRGACRAIGSECRMGSDDDCKRSLGCEESGACVARGGGCVASEAEHCVRSRGCLEQGCCSLVDGGCRVGSDDDCKRSDRCRRAGACRFDGKRGCVN